MSQTGKDPRSVRPWRMIERRKSRTIRVGGLDDLVLARKEVVLTFSGGCGAMLNVAADLLTEDAGVAFGAGP